MLSPMPLGPEVAPPLMSPGGQLLASPLGLTFPSPGRTPGAHVLQESRLSLEMLGMLPPDALAGYAATGVPPGISAPLNAEASVRAEIAGVLKSECFMGFYIIKVVFPFHDTACSSSSFECFTSSFCSFIDRSAKSFCWQPAAQTHSSGSCDSHI